MTLRAHGANEIRRSLLLCTLGPHSQDLCAHMGRTRYVVRPFSAHLARISGTLHSHGANEIRRSPLLCTFRPESLKGQSRLLMEPAPLIMGYFTAPQLWARAAASFCAIGRQAHLVLARRCTPRPTVNRVGASCSIVHNPRCFLLGFLLLIFRCGTAYLNMIK